MLANFCIFFAADSQAWLIWGGRRFPGGVEMGSRRFPGGVQMGMSMFVNLLTKCSRNFEFICRRFPGGVEMGRPPILRRGRNGEPPIPRRGTNGEEFRLFSDKTLANFMKEPPIPRRGRNGEPPIPRAGYKRQRAKCWSFCCQVRLHEPSCVLDLPPFPGRGGREVHPIPGGVCCWYP